MKKIILSLITVICCITVSAQNRFFIDAGQNTTLQTSGDRKVIPTKFRSATLNAENLKSFLWSLPAEEIVRFNRGMARIMELPMPDGSMARFRVWESSIQEPELAAKFPEMKTFAGQGIDDPRATIRFDYNPYFGFSAQILSPNGRVFIDPYARFDINSVVSYYAKDMPRSRSINCLVTDSDTPKKAEGIQTEANCLGTNLRTYRLAIACTGEYSRNISGNNNPTAGQVHAAVLTSANRVNGVYELELSIRLVLIGNNNLIEYLDPSTDPYSGPIGGALLNQNQANIDAVIGVANYDIGHIFSGDDSGLAQLNAVCGSGKARGATGRPNPTGDPFDIDYVAHEMGHQFGAPHTFNTTTCFGGAPAGGSYEPGGGTTIMAYAGICGSTENIQPNSDPIFHTKSFDDISTFIAGSGGSCAVLTPTGNTLPVITSMPNNNISIPVNTPFTLTATATDADGDPLTYNWEGWDIGAAGSWPSAGATIDRPLFRTRVSKTTGTRTFPDMRVIVANYPGTTAPSAMDGLRGEVLPSVARPMKFRLTVRDVHNGLGGVVASGLGACQNGTNFVINAVGTAPFAVTVPNGGESYFGASSQTITWNVVGTDAAPVNVANVRITLSTDGGLTYPTVIEASTPNDGSQVVTIPAVVSTTARVRIEALGNIFFDISNANFTINAAPNGFVFDAPAPVVSAACPAAATMQTTLTASYTGSFSTPIVLTSSVTPTTPVAPIVTLTPALLQTGTMSTVVAITNANLLPAGSYTVTVTGTAGAIVVSRNIVFTINATGGPAIITQPLPQTVCAGTNATFTVAATGTYQWQVSTPAVPAFTNIGGATSASYTVIAPAAVANGNQYRVLVSGQCGVTTSNAALLTVNTAPSIGTHPQSVTLCAGASNTFTAAATGSGISYQWQISTPAVPAFTDIPLANGTSYTVNPITAGMNGNQYRVVVTGTCPTPATSNPATLTVVTSVTITGQPASTTVCDGATATFTAAGSGPGVIYQWQVNTGTGFVNVPVGAPYSGSTTGTLTINPATPAMSTYQYRAQLSNATCTTPAVTDVATLTVNQLPVITSNPTPQTICLGGNTTFTVAATGTGLSYQWQMSTPAAPAFVNVPAAAPYSGTTTATLTITGATAAMTGNQYRALVTGTCTPAGVNSTAALLTVIVPVSITTQAAATAEICSGSNTSFTVVGSSTQQPITYQWQVNTGAGFTNVANTAPYSGANTATLTITNAPTSLSGAIYRLQLSNTTCSTPTVSNSSVLTVRQLPTVGLTAAPLLALLPGQSTTLTATPSAQTTGTLTTTWLKNGAAISNAGNTRIVNVENIGTYRVNIQEAFTSGLVCSNQSADVVITATPSDRLFIFPSPNDGRFTVSYYNNSGAATTRLISVYDSKGDRVRFKTFPITGPYTLLSFDLRPAQKGIYYVVVGDANGKVLINGKVIVQ